MNKLIIDNRSDLNDYEALEVVQRVIKEGRISNNNRQYCYFMVVMFYNKQYQIASFLNEKSDRFVINNQKQLK